MLPLSQTATGTLTPTLSITLTPIYVTKRQPHAQRNCKGKGKDRVLAIALLTRELVTRSALQSRNWQLIGMS